MNYFVQSYTCESGAIGRIVIPENATEDDLLAFKDFLEIIVRERLKRLKKPRMAGKRGTGMKRTYDAEFFNGKCPYTDKPCYEWECDTCEVEAEEKKSMEELDKAESEG